MSSEIVSKYLGISTIFHRKFIHRRLKYWEDARPLTKRYSLKNGARAWKIASSAENSFTDKLESAVTEITEVILEVKGGWVWGQ